MDLSESSIELGYCLLLCSCPSPVLTGSQQLTINAKLAKLGNSEYQPAAVLVFLGYIFLWLMTEN